MRALKWILVLLMMVPALVLAADKTELTWYGHSAFKLVTPSGKVILIDPWLTNPANKKGREDLIGLLTDFQPPCSKVLIKTTP